MTFPAAIRGTCLLVALALSTSATALAGRGEVWSREQASAPAIKAAYLFNFAKFTEWPSDVVPAGSPIVVCVADDSQLTKALEETMTGREANGHRLVVRRIAIDGSLQSCQILYAHGLEGARAAALARTLDGSPVLTVSDSVEFVRAGGVAGFFVEDGRMRFAVNVDAASRGRIKISSRLLNLSVIVKDDLNAARR